MNDELKALIQLLMPLVPSLVQTVTAIVNAAKAHADTPDAARAQLDSISATLADLKTQVASIVV
jgi:hypothetical protein